ncbi:MAG TPA: hypothetical protein VF101_16195 [Gaiellaceae bacterium]
MRRTAVVAAVVAGLSAFAAPSAIQGGERSAASLDIAYAVALQPDGKLVVAGRTASGHWRFALARYDDRGRLDPRFGTGGTVVTDFGSHGYSYASAIAVQRDGKLVVAGRGRISAVDDFAIGRYTARGSLDPTFGRGGKTLTGFGSARGFSAWANSLAIQPDGKAVVAGTSGKSASRFALARYTTAGKLDRRFGRHGVVTTIQPSGQPSAVALQRDGKIVAAGTSFGGEREKIALERYTAEGRLDPSFGTGGKVITAIGSWNDGRALALQRDGKLVVAGQSGDDFAVSRYTATGRLDRSFGKGGDVVTPFGVRQDGNGLASTDEALAVAVQPDGKIVAAGASDVSGRSGEQHCCFDDFALVRYTADGRLDRSFGDGGKVLTEFDGNASVHAIVIQPDGKIVAAGGGAGSFALARYTSRGQLDRTFGNGGRVTTRFRD